MASILPRRLCALATVIIVVLGPMAPMALADPTTTGALADSPTLPLSDLGSSDSISFEVHRDVTSKALSFSAPQGLAPVALNATLELPVPLRFGSIAVTQDGRTISRMSLPAADQAQVVIPLAGLKVYGGWASATLTATAIPADDFCWDPLAPIRLVNASVSFSGREEAPTTVAGFLPAVLKKLTIAIPAKPSPAESDAAVQLAAAVTRRYGGQSPDIVVAAVSPGRSTPEDISAPLERHILLRESTDKGLSLQGAGPVPSLSISGPGPELTNQTRLLTDDSLQFAVSRKAVAAPLQVDQEVVADTTSLDDLKLSGLTSDALWPQVQFELNQSRFGHPLAGIRIHLTGSYTPLPSDFGGEVTVMVGTTTIARWPATSDGTIDRWVEVPNELVRRTTTVEVTVHTTGDPGHCGDYLPMTLRIDGSTVVEVHSANPPSPPGFQSLPQSLTPRVQFGIGRDAFADTRRAARIAMGLQQTSGIPLVTTVTSLKQALDSGAPAVLVSADAWNVPDVVLPFSTDQGRIDIEGVGPDGKPMSLTLDPAVRFGSMQTVFDGKRTILAATSNGAPAQLDQLLTWLGSERGRWSGLDGRALISVPGSAPMSVPNPPEEISGRPKTADAQGGSGWIWWAAGGVVAVAVLGAAMILFRLRGRRT
ncbi:hypothetical protein ACXDF8_03480 [Mycolicibacterium sp. CBM1]